MEASIDLPPDPTSVGTARRFVRSQLEEWSLDGVEDDAVLLTSELVTNAILHARTPMRLLIRRGEDSLRIAVSDESELRPVRRHYSQTAGTGRGLALVETIGADWGVDLTSVEQDAPSVTLGKMVWVDVPLQPNKPDLAMSAEDWLAQVEAL